MHKIVANFLLDRYSFPIEGPVVFFVFELDVSAAACQHSIQVGPCLTLEELGQPAQSFRSRCAKVGRVPLHGRSSVCFCLSGAFYVCLALPVNAWTSMVNIM